jgi:hypothetical protein
VRGRVVHYSTAGAGAGALHDRVVFFFYSLAARLCASSASTMGLIAGSSVQMSHRAVGQEAISSFSRFAVHLKYTISLGESDSCSPHHTTPQPLVNAQVDSRAHVSVLVAGCCSCSEKTGGRPLSQYKSAHEACG